MMFRGTIEDAETYHMKMGITVNYQKDVSWKPWTFKYVEDIDDKDVKFQFCSTAKYAGDGYLFNKIGTRKYYVLSEWPNGTAVKMMINASWTLQRHSAQQSRICHKTFRSRDLHITECSTCLQAIAQASIEQAKMERANMQKKEKEKRELELSLADLEHKKEGLKQQYKVYRDKTRELQMQLKEKEKMKSIVENRLQSVLHQKQKMIQKLKAEVDKSEGEKHNVQKHLTRIHNVQIQMLDTFNKKSDDLYKSVIELNGEMGGVKSRIASMVTNIASSELTVNDIENKLLSLNLQLKKNFSIGKLLLMQILSDTNNVIGRVFGNIAPNKHIRSNLVELKLRELPPFLDEYLRSLSIMDKEYTLSDFIERIPPEYGAKIQNNSNYGRFVNLLAGSTSVGHMKLHELKILNAYLGTNKIDIKGTVKNVAHTMLKHLYNLKNVDPFDRYKYITHIALKSKKRTHCTDLYLAVKLRSFKKKDGKWEEDPTLEEGWENDEDENESESDDAD